MDGAAIPPAEERSCYLAQSAYSDPGEIPDLPADPRALARIVRGLLVHREETAWFGFRLPPERRNEAETRYVSRILETVRSRDAAPLDQPRRPADRFAGTCRDFALLLCALLRATGTPARLRCGFADYFVPGFHEDHWVTEYRAPGRGWLLADAQVAGDPAAGPRPRLGFDPLDVPRDRFLVAGAAWLACRSGAADPESFGVGLLKLAGLWFVRADLVRDLAALNKAEVLPWDVWGLAEAADADLRDGDLRVLDAVAAASVRGGPPAELRRLHLGNPGLRTPRSVRSHTTYGGVRTVELPV